MPVAARPNILAISATWLPTPPAAPELEIRSLSNKPDISQANQGSDTRQRDRPDAVRCGQVAGRYEWRRSMTIINQCPAIPNAQRCQPSGASDMLSKT